MPARGQWTGLRFAIADDAGRDQVWIVEDGAVGVRKGVTQFAALVDRTGCFRGNVAGNAAGERELFEQSLHSLLVLRDVRVNLAVGAFQVGVGHQPRSAVSRTSDINDTQ